MTTEHKTAAALTPSREEAERAALALGKIEYLTEICEMANLPHITVGVAEMRAVLSYVEWLVAERKETFDALAAMGGAK